MMKDREAGDYPFFEAISRDDAEENLRTAKELVETLRRCNKRLIHYMVLLRSLFTFFRVLNNKCS